MSGLNGYCASLLFVSSVTFLEPATVKQNGFSRVLAFSHSPNIPIIIKGKVLLYLEEFYNINWVFTVSLKKDES